MKNLSCRHLSMDKSWISKGRLSQEYLNGIKSFVEFSVGKLNTNMIKCPCQKCRLVKYKHKSEVEEDLICFGFLPTYTNWYLHGEDIDFQEQTVDGDGNFGDSDSDSSQDMEDMENLLNDVFPTVSSSLSPEESNQKEDHSEQNEFDELMKDGKEPLYDGCTKFSKLSFLLKLYHIKCMSRMSDKAIAMIIELLKEAFESAKLPGSFGEMKKIVRKLEFSYECIDACPNDCMLYWCDDATRDECKVCKTSRWKPQEEEKEDETTVEETETKKKKKKKQAAKILRYFPLKPRLQRLYKSTKTAESMRWHASSENRDGRLRHPRDGEAWKSFNQEFPEFAKDPRNVRLGLASDGFNPFGNMGSSYSIWPVLLVPYNLPPWMAMKQTSTILSMVIPGKSMPGNDIDVYLQPLIKELRELWFDGVSTFDACSKETFSMRAALLWTISDFPGLENLSGWNTHTGLACPCCNFDSKEHRLENKYCFIGHRRFLSHDHKFRTDMEHFDGDIETRSSPITPSGTDILRQLENVEVVLGKNPETVGKKRRRKGPVQQWKKRSIFFQLPYWKKLLLRHNLDLMHIEKNVFDNIINTLFDDKGKSKDNLNARKDLQKLGIRPELWPDEHGLYLPACFTMNNGEKDRFLRILKSVKVPDGYSSNVSACVDLNQRKIVGLKSHDCHIMMGQLIPIAIRNVLPQEVAFAIIELCHFFRELSSKVLNIRELDKLQEHIALTLCHLEMIFPPSFFTVMVHLTIHLTQEMKLGGPVHYRWMYPIERTFTRFKSYVRNKAKPEGSICEQYIADECLTFCSMCLDGVETRFNRIGRVDDRSTVKHNLSSNSEIPVAFPSLGRSASSSDYYKLNPIEWKQAHRYILVNAGFLDDYRK